MTIETSSYENFLRRNGKRHETSVMYTAFGGLYNEKNGKKAGKKGET